MRSVFPFAHRIVVALAFVAAAGCHGKTEVPGQGAALLLVSVGTGAPVPDELRAFVYDDTGTLWSDVRFPSQGALVPESASRLGTILVQPGSTTGDLRIDLRGLLAGALADEGTLRIPAGELSGGTFDMTLEAALPADGDGDGVPDSVDDCPSVPDPSQAGCAADGGGRTDAATVRDDAAADARHDAAADARHDAAADGPAVRADASRDASPGNKGTGSGCGRAAECASGFCTDGVCCKTACTDPCNSCTTGTCNAVKNGEDAPECIAPMTCDKKGKCVAAASGGN